MADDARPRHPRRQERYAQLRPGWYRFLNVQSTLHKHEIGNIYEDQLILNDTAIKTLRFRASFWCYRSTIGEETHS